MKDCKQTDKIDIKKLCKTNTCKKNLPTISLKINFLLTFAFFKNILQYVFEFYLMQAFV